MITKQIEQNREDLPTGWAIARLSELFNPSREKELPSKYPNLPFIGMEHIAAHRMILIGKARSSEMKSSAVHFYPNDVLYGRLRPYLNKVFRPDFEGLCSAEFIVLSCFHGLEPKYIQYVLNSAAFVTFASSLNAGDRPRVSFDQIGEYLVRIPPTAEQHRIVAKIEELFSDLDAGVETLKTTHQQLRIYRQAVLKWAFEGKSTEWWRQQQARLAPLETVSELLKDIAAQWSQSKCEKTGNKAKIKDIQILDRGELPEVPNSWCYVRAEMLSEFITKGTTPPKNEMTDRPGEIPFIKVYNLTTNGALDFSVDPTFVSQNVHDGFLNRSKVLPGDVLMNIVGPPLGKVSIVPSAFPEWNINQAVVRFRSNGALLPKFLAYYLLSQVTVDRMVRRAKATAGQFNLTLEICRDLEIPLTVIAEQQQIVDDIEKRLSVCEELEKCITENLQRAEVLRQGILKLAFEGKLVQQDPNDEHAEELLKRITEQRSENGAHGVSAKKRQQAKKKPRALVEV